MSVQNGGRQYRKWATDPCKDLENGKILRPSSTTGLRKMMGFIIILSITSVLVTLLTIYYQVTWKLRVFIYLCIAGLFLLIYK